MQRHVTTRRQFMQVSAAAAATVLVPLAPATAAPAIRLGGPVFVKTDDPVELALAHKKLGYHAGYCPNIPLQDSARISALAQAFQKHDVVLAEVGRWVNLIDADPAARAKNLATVTDGLALAEAAGALCCVDIVGSYNKVRWDGPHPDNLSQTCFDAAVENARKIIDAVKPQRAKFCYEMMPWTIPDGPDSNLKLIKAVDRKGFAVHLDPCNIVNSPGRFYRNAALLQECFDKLGQWIVSCHAKDLSWEAAGNVYFKEVRPGAGGLDYRTYLSLLSKLPQSAPLMLEHLPNAQEYDLARQHVQKVAAESGIQIS
jgi:sugar phosphate isomerase/epimerase